MKTTVHERGGAPSHWRRWRGALFVVGAGLTAFSVAFAAVHFGPGLYSHLKARRLLSAAEREAALGHVESATRLYALCIERNSTDPRALASYAAYLQRIRHPAVIPVLRRLRTVTDHSPAIDLDLASACLTFGQIHEALTVLRAPDLHLRGTARYYHLLAVARFLSGSLPEADDACREALRLDPGNRTYLANSATLELASPSDTVRTHALEALEKLTQEAQVAPTALQSLLRYAARCDRAPERLDAWLERFQEIAGPRDYLYTVRLEALRRHRPADFERDLRKYIAEAGRDFAHAELAMRWLEQERLPAEALGLWKSVDPTWKGDIRFTVWAAQACVDLGRIEDARSILGLDCWRAFPAELAAWDEYLRWVESGRKERKEADLARWRKAISAANGDLSELTALLVVARRWGWLDAYRETLWTVARSSPGDAADALTDLFHLEFHAGNTLGLLAVARRQLELEPTNPVYANNLAFLDLLLDIDVERGRSLANDLCRSFPGSPQFAATRAFDALQRGTPEEGLKCFDGLDVMQLRGTAPGVTYGLLLAASRNSRADEFLKGADVWMRLPEEQKLLDEARRKMESASEASGKQ